MVTVLDSKDLITHLTTGETPVPTGVAEDNAKQKAAAALGNGKAMPKDPEKASTKAAEVITEANDDVEDEDGLTPRQKRELSETMRKAIGKKHREMKEAEEFAADQYNQRRLADDRAANLERQLAELKAQTTPASKVEPPKEPKREDFQTEQAYQDARVDWRAEQKFQEKQAREALERAQAEEARIAAAAEARLRQAAELVPDFAEVVDHDLRIPGHIAGYMRESDMFAELGYHFGQHPDVIDRLAKLSPAKALVEVGKIESTLKPFSETHKGDGKANGKEPSPNASTEASTQTGESPSKPRGTAPVITPLSAGSTSQVEKDPRGMNIRETIADWQKKNQRNLGLRKRH